MLVSSTMNSRSLSSLIFIAYLFVCVTSEGDVLELTESNFKEEVKKYEVLLVKFFAPWCGHCKRLAPEFDKAASKLLKNDPAVHLADVDCTKHKKICDDYGVSGFPTLKIFRNGEFAQDFDGPREAEGIVKYMRAQTGPSAKEVKGISEFDAALQLEDSVVFGFFESDSKLKDSFLKVADTERDRYQFMYTSNKEILKKVGYTDDIIVYVPKKLHNKFEEGYFQYDGNYDTDKIKTFLVEETNGLAGVRTVGNLFQFDRKPLFVVYYKLDYTLDPKGSSYWRNRVLMVAKDFKRKAYFAVSNKADFSAEMEERGLEKLRDSDKPVVAAITNLGKFPMKEEFSVENFKQFVKDVLAEKLEPYMKSEEAPKEQGNVKIIVGKTFKEDVLDTDKDVFIEFYAPWCGHCKALAPKYDELGDKMADEPGVAIAKIDATANDFPPMFEVRGFPTIYWLPKNAKDKPVLYDGGREVDDFVKYIAKHATLQLKGYKRSGMAKEEL